MRQHFTTHILSPSHDRDEDGEPAAAGAGWEPDIVDMSRINNCRRCMYIQQRSLTFAEVVYVQHLNDARRSECFLLESVR